jgi:carbon starvation protein
MLLEGIMALSVLSIVASGLDFSTYKSIVFPQIKGMASNPILAFALALGSVMQYSIGIPKVYGTVFGILLVEGFVVTTLDTSVRLCRYLLEELWSIIFKKVPALFKSYLFNAFLVVGISYLLAITNSISKIWPIFGTANQLLAAFVLIVAAVWLSARKKPIWFVTIPAAFMLVTTIASLIYLLVIKYFKEGNIPLIISDVVLLALSIGFVILIISKFTQRKTATAG